MPPKEKIIGEIDTVIYEICHTHKIELGDPLLNVLSTKAEDILAGIFVNDKAIEEKITEQLKDEYKFDDIKDAFDEEAVPHQLEFFYGGAKKTLWWLVTFCHLTKAIMSLYCFYARILVKT